MSSWPWWAGGAFAVACAGTWLARRYALRRRLIDQPGERHSHQVATPRGGGIAIVLALLPLLAWLAWRAPAERPLFVAVATGLLLVAGIGWLDDHRPLSPWLRLGVHVLASACLAFGVAAGAGPAILAVSVCTVEEAMSTPEKAPPRIHKPEAATDQ